MTDQSKTGLSARFDYVGNPSEGLIAVQKDKKWFHVRPDGTPAYIDRYEKVGDFVNGMAYVLENGNWKRIRPDGSTVIIQ